MNISVGYRGPNEFLLLIVSVLSITSFVLWIIFWSQLNGAKNKFQGMSLQAGDDSNLDAAMSRVSNVRNAPEPSNESAPKPAAITEKEKLESLREYKSLLKEGVITEEEFNMKKSELLG